MKIKIFALALLLGVSGMSIAQINGAGLKINQFSSSTGTYQYGQMFNDDDDVLTGSLNIASVDFFYISGLKETSAFRIRGGFRSIKAEGKDNWSFNNNTDFRESGATFKLNSYSVAPGILRFLNADKFRFFTGIEMPVTYIAKTTLEGYDQDLDAAGNILIEDKYTLELPNGFSVGVGGVVGFQYLALDRVGVGLELGSSLAFTQISGDVREIDNFNGGGDNIDTAPLEVKRVGFTPLSTSLNMTYYF